MIGGNANLPETAGAATPAVSVIIPTRNRRDVLGQAIASARAQTLPPAEIIVVDDASTDGTADWLRAEHPDIRLIVLSERGGAPSARNAGIDVASGEFLAFLDSDDCFMAQKLERQLGALQDSGAAFSTCGFVDFAGRDYCTAPLRPGQIQRRNSLGGTSGLVGRRDILRRVQFDPSMPAVQDWDLYLRLLSHGPVAHIPAALYRYGTGGDDRITRDARRRFLGHAALWRRHFRNSPGLGWRTRMAHDAVRRMLICNIRGWRARALFWRGLYRVLAG